MRFFLLPLLLSTPLAHSETIAVGRYTRIAISAPSAPLSTPVLSKFVAPRVIGDAVTLILARTGYRLAAARNADPMQAELLAMTLPDAHRDLSAMRSIDALVLLGAPGYRVMVDHVHRLVGFEVKPRFWSYGQSSELPRNDPASPSAWHRPRSMGSRSTRLRSRSPATARGTW